MAINKAFMVPTTGVEASHHVVHAVEAVRPFVLMHVQVHAYVSQAAANAGLVPVWNNPVEVPTTEGVLPAVEAIETWLVSDERSPLFGGSVAGA